MQNQKNNFITHRAKKSLGQNFLKSETILKKIVEAGEVSKDDIVLEIGPGKGDLTKKLLESARQVIAVEKDRNLVEFLKEKFKKEIENKKLILIEGDILKIKTKQNVFEQTLGRSDGEDSRKFSAENFRGESENILQSCKNYKIIANIPYNITGAILKKFLTEGNQPSLMVLMVQHEVAKRIIARDNKESILSISVKAYGNPKLITKVPARYFSPAPKVDSAIISIKNISRDFFEKNKINENIFWQVIHAGFAHKRKMLINNLAEVGPRQNLEKIFSKCQIKTTIRAEDLTIKDWLCLTSVLQRSDLDK